MEPTLVTETSEVKTQTPGKFPEESTLVLNLLFGSHISFYLLHCYAFSKVHHICEMLTAHVGNRKFSITPTAVDKSHGFRETFFLHLLDTRVNGHSRLLCNICQLKY
jgi:hypothetical protein